MNDADLQFPSVYQRLFQHSTSTKNPVYRTRLLRLFSDCSFSWIGKGQVMICCRISSLSIPHVRNIGETPSHLWQVRKFISRHLPRARKKQPVFEFSIFLRNLTSTPYIWISMQFSWEINSKLNANNCSLLQNSSSVKISGASILDGN